MTTDDGLQALHIYAEGRLDPKAWKYDPIAIQGWAVAALIQRSKRLEEAEDIVQELRDIQNGCPLPTWQEQFDAINARADAFLAERDA